MRRVHPLWRGFWLAGMMAAYLALLGWRDWLTAFRPDRVTLALGGGVAAGAFLAALPGRLRRLKRRPERPVIPAWPRWVRAFLCGAAMTLGCAMAGTGRVLPALMEGSVGAYAFVGAAWLSGLIAVRIAGYAEKRRARA